MGEGTCQIILLDLSPAAQLTQYYHYTNAAVAAVVEEEESSGVGVG